MQIDGIQYNSYGICNGEDITHTYFNGIELERRKVRMLSHFRQKMMLDLFKFRKNNSIVTTSKSKKNKMNDANDNATCDEQNFEQ